MHAFTFPKIRLWSILRLDPFASVKAFPKKLHLLVGQAKIRTEFTSPIAKSTSPGISDTTFFAHCHSVGVKYSAKTNYRVNIRCPRQS